MSLESFEEEKTAETSFESIALDFSLSYEEISRCIDELPNVLDRNIDQTNLKNFIKERGYRDIEFQLPPADLVYFIKE